MLQDSSTAQAYWLVAPGRGEIRSETLSAPKADEVRVRTLYTAISRGTESLIFRGEVPPSQYQAMRAPFQQGDFPAPVKYGYCNVGQVEAGPKDWCGRTVFCLYPHQDRYVVPIAATTPVPNHIPPGRAVLAANMETALNVLWDAAPRLGDRITIIGAGLVGCLIARLASGLPGCQTQLVDIDSDKAALVEQLGVTFVLPDRAAGAQDVLIHASGAPEGLRTALGLAGFEAVVVEASWFGVHSVNLPLGEEFHSKRLIIRSSQVGTIATAQRARWDYRRRMATAISLLGDPTLDFLISGESPFAELPRMMAELNCNPRGVLCHRLTYTT